MTVCFEINQTRLLLLLRETGGCVRPNYAVSCLGRLSLMVGDRWLRLLDTDSRGRFRPIESSTR